MTTVATPAERLARLDRAHVWHPYAALPASEPPLLVESASGVCIRLADGTTLVDGMASWWCAIHGYRHPALDQAAQEQLGRMSHVMFGGLTHAPAIELAVALVKLAPAGLEHVFFADSGSVSVEVALKLCIQYWRARGQERKSRVLALRGAYHGDTLGAMSICDPVGGMHQLFNGVVAEQVFADRPPAGFDAPLDPAYIEHLERLIERHADELAAVVVEPAVQGAGGMHFYAPGYLSVLRELCSHHDVLLVFDEIATGFWRTGECFAADHVGVEPDVLCVGKALTGGYLSLAATLCTTEIATTISEGTGALMHGPTFMANPLACSVALASLKLLDDQDMRARIGSIAGLLGCELAPARELDNVLDVRVLGAIGVVQLAGPVDVPAATAAAIEHGVWLRPFRDLIYVMPPYIATDDELAQIGRAVVAAARHAH